jgi:hypothetical protein
MTVQEQDRIVRDGVCWVLTPIVAMKNPALCESHPNISEDRQGTEETIISYKGGRREGRKVRGNEGWKNTWQRRIERTKWCVTRGVRTVTSNGSRRKGRKEGRKEGRKKKERWLSDVPVLFY